MAIISGPNPVQSGELFISIIYVLENANSLKVDLVLLIIRMSECFYLNFDPRESVTCPLGKSLRMMFSRTSS